MKNEEQKIQLPVSGSSKDSADEFILRELALGRIDRPEDIPPDEECEGIFEIETKEQRG